MAVTDRTTTTSNIGSSLVKEIDFVSRFQRNWDALIEIMGISRPIRKTLGTQLVVSKASVELQSGLVAEGDEVPLSQATVTPVAYEDITLEKFRKRVTAEAVAKFGAEVASQKTDDAFLNELTNTVLTRFYQFIKTPVNGAGGTDTPTNGSTTNGTASTFQEAVAMSVATVKNEFKNLRLDYSNIVVFVNTLDVGKYLGTANISMQTRNGIEYFKDFLGAQTVIVSSDIEQGTVIAIPADNMVLYYIDPSDGGFEALGLNYTTGHEASNLIGVHKEAVYGRVSGDTHAIMGMKLFVEYTNGVSKYSGFNGQ